MELDQWRLSQHLQEQLAERGIPSALLTEVLRSPEQTGKGYGGCEVRQSRVILGEKEYLLRIVVDSQQQPPCVVTAYLTSKISKYWQGSS